MFPLRDTIPARRPPVAVYVLLGLNGLVYLAQSALPEQWFLEFIDLLAVHPDRFDERVELAPTAPPLVYLSLISSQYLHGGLLHLLGNMWSLWIFGDNVEDRMGSARFLMFYTLCGILAGGIHVLSDPDSTIPTLGASGAIAGVMGAYLFLYPRAKLVLFVPLVFIPIFLRTSATVFLGLWFVLQYFSGRAQDAQGEDAGGVAYWAHLGGFLAGAALHRAFVQSHDERHPPYRDEFRPEQAWR